MSWLKETRSAHRVQLEKLGLGYDIPYREEPNCRFHSDEGRRDHKFAYLTKMSLTPQLGVAHSCGYNPWQRTSRCCSFPLHRLFFFCVPRGHPWKSKVFEKEMYAMDSECILASEPRCTTALVLCAHKFWTTRITSEPVGQPLRPAFVLCAHEFWTTRVTSELVGQPMQPALVTHSTLLLGGSGEVVYRTKVRLSTPRTVYVS